FWSLVRVAAMIAPAVLTPRRKNSRRSFLGIGTERIRAEYVPQASTFLIDGGRPIAATTCQPFAAARGTLHGPVGGLQSRAEHPALPQRRGRRCRDHVLGDGRRNGGDLGGRLGCCVL